MAVIIQNTNFPINHKGKVTNVYVLKLLPCIRIECYRIFSLQWYQDILVYGLLFSFLCKVSHD